MPSPSTHQDSPKVPERMWPPVKLGHKEVMRLTTWDAYPAAVEEEAYIPVSALLSDEAVERIAGTLYFYQRGAYWAKADAGDKETYRIAARRELEAVIEQVGGAERGK